MFFFSHGVAGLLRQSRFIEELFLHTGWVGPSMKSLPRLDCLVG